MSSNFSASIPASEMQAANDILNNTAQTSTVLQNLPVTGNFESDTFTVGNWINVLLMTGRIYSLIMRGVSSTTQEITDTETWVNGKTGAY